MTHLGTTAMTPKIFKVIEGGRDQIERNFVIALFEGDIDKVDRLSEQLETIARKFLPEFSILPNQQGMGG